MKISEFFQELKNRNRLLYYFGWLNVLLFAVCLLYSFIDTTNIVGVNAWLKPMKFAITVTIYVWTFAWILEYLTSKRNKSIISWIVLISMFAENFIITLQAARGQTSHYNITSALNALLFSIMGLFIFINSLINLYTLILFFIKTQVTLRGTMLIAWRAGLLLFFVGGVAGGLMITNMGHTFGAADGGIGLPFTNWSTQAGDMRVAHFFSLHGLQIIPLFAWYLAQKTKWPLLLTILFFALYSIICVGMHLVALSGLPLIRL